MFCAKEIEIRFGIPLKQNELNKLIYALRLFMFYSK